VESEAIPYELLVITVMIDVGEELRSWDFAFILTGYHHADIACQQRRYFLLLYFHFQTPCLLNAF
jgi:hypothetical protein